MKDEKLFDLIERDKHAMLPGKDETAPSLIMHNEGIFKVRQKEINTIAQEIKSEVNGDHTIGEVLLAWAEDARIVSEWKCETILLAVYQIGKEHGRNEVLSTQQRR